MLKNTIVIGLLCYSAEQVQATNHQYRPYVNGRTPWYTKVPHKRDPTFPFNYPVVNLGVDKSVQDTLNHAAAVEKRIGHKFDVKAYDAKFIHPWEPSSYPVPNFGQDRDIAVTNKHLSQAETRLKYKWTDKEALAVPAVIPRGYKVANFGQDREITGDWDNLAIVEKRFNHKLNLSDIAKKNQAPDIPAVHAWGMDHEIKTSLKNLADTEKKLGVRFTPEFVQTFVDLSVEDAEEDDAMVQLQSDPICASAGCTQYKAADKGHHPMNYFVPDFGMDHDIIDSMEDMGTAEKDSGVEIKVPKKKDKKAVVQVPNLGVDAEIKRAQQSIKEAEHGGALVEMDNLPEYM